MIDSLSLHLNVCSLCKSHVILPVMLLTAIINLIFLACVRARRLSVANFVVFHELKTIKVKDLHRIVLDKLYIYIFIYLMNLISCLTYFKFSKISSVLKTVDQSLYHDVST